jgi:hypothetical protein
VTEPLISETIHNKYNYVQLCYLQESEARLERTEMRRGLAGRLKGEASHHKIRVTKMGVHAFLILFLTIYYHITRF